MISVGCPVYLHNSLDPNYSSVVLLLKGENNNGSTTFTDDGPLRFVPTSSVATVNTTTIAKFGQGSIFSTGTYRIQYATSTTYSQSAFANSIWCMETWVYLPFGLYGTFPSNEFTLGNNANSPSTPNWTWATTYIEVYTGAAFHRCPTSTPAAATWHHVVVQKNTTTNSASTSSVDFWLNGTKLVASLGGTWSTGATQPFQVGRGDGAARPARYLDEFRITIGALRYTPNAPTITVPDREYGYAPR